MAAMNVVLHPSDMAQSGWVRCISPLMQFMGPNEYRVVPSIMNMPNFNKEWLKTVRTVIIQRPANKVMGDIAAMYAKLKQECGFKLVTDIDDLLWEVSPVLKSFTNGVDYDEMIKNCLRHVLPLFDKVVCSTRYLSRRLKQDIGVNAEVMPNAVSKILFGFSQKQNAFSGVPRVMYAGGLGHCSETVLGDFEGPWVPWLRKRIEEGSIDFYVFGAPAFLKGLEGKYTSIPFTTFLQFPSVAASYKPDFYLAPLSNISFNKAKSDLKLKEAAVLGAVFLGSDFSDSPYGYAPPEQLVQWNASAEELDAKFNNLCDSANYMKALSWQYRSIEEKHWLYEDPLYIKKYASVYL